MNRQEFLQGLEKSLSGNVNPRVVQDNLRYYDDYIRTEIQKGRTEQQVMEELGEPRLIAHTILDTTPGADEGAYEEYRSSGVYGSGDEGRSYQDGGRSQRHQDPRSFNKGYWKSMSMPVAIITVVCVLILVFTILAGLLSLIIPLLPAIGLIILIMWFVRGPRR